MQSVTKPTLKPQTVDDRYIRHVDELAVAAALVAKIARRPSALTAADIARIASSPVAQLRPDRRQRWVSGADLGRVWQTQAPEALSADLERFHGELPDRSSKWAHR